MLTDRMQAALNDQINMELSAFYTYLSMSAYFEDRGLKGFAGWLRHHAEEEMMHAMKLYDFINARRGRVALKTLAAPATDWPSTIEAFEDALRHEQKVTAAINNLVNLAREERDYATDSFLQWFVDEQVEEEEIVDEVIQKLRLIGDFSPGVYMLDRELTEGAARDEAEASAE